MSDLYSLEEKRLHALYEVMSLSGLSYDDQMQQALKIGVEMLDFDIGIISEITGTEYTVLYGYDESNGVQAGQKFDLGDTYCNLTFEADDLISIEDVKTSAYEGHPCYHAFGLESYIGVPIFVSGVRYGTINFSSPNPHEIKFTESDLEFFRTMARWIGTLLEKKQTQETLVDLSNFQTTMLNSADYAIISTDLDGTILTWNKAAEENLGYTAEEMVGKQNPGIFHDPNEVVVRAKVLTKELGQVVEPGFGTFVAKAALTGEPDENEWTYIRKDGSRYPVLLSVTPLYGEDGQTITGYLGIAVDLTERKTAETERERLIKELERAVLFKDQFLATMSHELRTPLNAIQGYAGLIMMEDDVDKDILHMTERMNSNATRLLNLINDVLDISRINAQRVEIVQRPTKIREIAQGWHSDFMTTATQKKLEFELDIADGVPETIIGDSERITQITANLIQNAFKFTDEGKISIAVNAKDDHLLISVTDTGLGIAETWQHLVFDEFRQVDGSSKRKYGGAGLGLSIVKKLCVLMGGNVTLTSKLGTGSTFTIDLPLQAVAVAGEEA